MNKAQCEYPVKISAKADPNPPAIIPGIGPNKIDATKIILSPIFTYPSVIGIGICITIVVIQTRAIIIPFRTINFVLLFIHISSNL